MADGTAEAATASVEERSTTDRGLRASWRRVRRIGRTELRRRWRKLRDNQWQLAATAFALLFFLPTSLFVFVGAFFAGRAIGAGDVETPVRFARLAVVYGWLAVAGFGGYRVYATMLRPDALDGHLTTVSHRELLAGLCYAESALWGVPIGIYAGIATLVFAFGAGAPAALLFVPLAVVLALATGLGTGVLLALVVRNLGVRSRLLARLRTVLFAVLGLAYFGVIMTQSVGDVLEPLLVVLEPSPVGWLGDLALFGTTTDAAPGRAAGAVLASLLVLPALAVATARLAEALWYADGVHVEHEVESTHDGGETSRIQALLARVFSRPTREIVVADWKRARRAPVSKSYVLYPLFFLIWPLTTALETGTVPGSLPLWLALLGPWIVGAAFALNPLGNEGAVLPTTLLADTPGRSLVVGHVAASTLVGVPVVVATVLVLGVLSPMAAATTATLAAGAVVLTICAGPIAAGVGALFPRFEAVSVTRSTRAVVPSVLAFAGYSIVLGIVAIPALLGHSAFLGGLLADVAGVSRSLVGAAGTVATAVLAGAFAVGAGYYAIDEIEKYTVE